MEGIIYKITEYKDNSLLLHVITKYRKVTLVATGARNLKSQNRMLCQYLNLISFEDKLNKDMFNLKDGLLIDSFNNVKENYDSIVYVSYLMSLVSKIDTDIPQIYDIIIDVLRSSSPQIKVLQSLIKLVFIYGYKMDFKPKSKDILGFSISDGSFIYETNKHIDLNNKHTLVLLKIFAGDFEDINDDDKERILKFINSYYQYHLGFGIV